MLWLLELVLPVIAAICALGGVVALVGAFSRWSFVRLSQKQSYLKKVVHLWIAIAFFGLPLMMYHPVLPQAVVWSCVSVSFAVIVYGCFEERRQARRAAAG